MVDAVVIFAVGGGTGVGWFAAGLAIAAAQAAARFASVSGKATVQLPPIAHTRAGEITYLVASCGISLFCLVGLILAL